MGNTAKRRAQQTLTITLASLIASTNLANASAAPLPEPVLNDANTEHIDRFSRSPDLPALYDELGGSLDDFDAENMEDDDGGQGDPEDPNDDDIPVDEPTPPESTQPDDNAQGSQDGLIEGETEDDDQAADEQLPGDENGDQEGQNTQNPEGEGSENLEPGTSEPLDTEAPGILGTEVLDPANPEVAPALSVTGRVSLNVRNVELTAIYSNGNGVWTEAGPDELVNNKDGTYTYTREDFANNGKNNSGAAHHGFVVFFLRPYNNHLLNGLRADNTTGGDPTGDRYLLEEVRDDQANTQLHAYPALSSVMDDYLDRGYVACFGFSRYKHDSDRNIVLNTTADINATEPKLKVTAARVGENAEYLEGDTITWKVTVAPDTVANATMEVKRTTITINGQAVPESDITNLGNGQYLVKYVAQQSDVGKDIKLGASASVSYTYTLGLTNQSVVTKSETIDMDNSDAVVLDPIPEMVKLNYMVDFVDDKGFVHVDGFGAESNEAYYTEVEIGTFYNTLPTVSPTQANCTFGGWYLDEGLTQPVPDDFAIMADTTLYGKMVTDIVHLNYMVDFADDLGFVNVNTDGAVVEEAVILDLEKGTTFGSLAEVSPSRENYVFSGWYLDKDLTQAVTADYAIMNDVTVYGQMSYVAPKPEMVQLNYMVDFADGNSFVHVDTSGGVVADAHYLSLEKGTLFGSLQEVSPSRENHTFSGWYLDKELTQPVTAEYAIQNNVTVYGQMTAATPKPEIVHLNYMVDFDDTLGFVHVNQSGEAVPDACLLSLEKGTLFGSLQEVSPTRDGYEFKGWYLDKELTQPVTAEYAIQNDVTVYGQMSAVTPKPEIVHLNYMVDFADGKGFINVDTDGNAVFQAVLLDLEKGTLFGSLKEVNPVLSGYTFRGWYLDKELNQPIDGAYAINADTTVYGIMEKQPDPGPGPGPGPSPNPDPKPDPKPDPAPNPEPGPDPTPKPEPTPDPGATPELAPEPTPDPGPTPEPTPVPIPEPGPTPAPIPGPVPAPDPEPVPDPDEPTLPQTGLPIAGAAVLTAAGAAAVLADKHQEAKERAAKVEEPQAAGGPDPKPEPVPVEDAPIKETAPAAEPAGRTAAIPPVGRAEARRQPTSRAKAEQDAKVLRRQLITAGAVCAAGAISVTAAILSGRGGRGK